MISDNRSEIRQVLWITLGLNIAVLLLKLLVATATNSLSLLADALHSITDCTNNVVALIAMHFASPFPDRDHPYGHQKFEVVGAIAIAGFLAAVCLEIVQGIVKSLIFGKHDITASPLDIAILLAVLGINIFVALYERRVGKRLGSPILIADAYHTMSDIWITILVIVGIVAVSTGIPQLRWVDIVLAVPVTILVFKTGYQTLSANLPVLVDEMAIPPEEIHDLVMSVEGVLNCHDIASRGLRGQQIFIEMHLIVAPEDIISAHVVTDAVEEMLHEQFAPVRITIHVEPPSHTSHQITYSNTSDASDSIRD